MLLTVHDSIIFEIKSDQVDFYAPKIIAIMQHPVGVPDFGVKFAVDGKEWK
jgi:DNA polymerase I-like protein with 3'-5' exonuclease and polymerase domains